MGRGGRRMDMVAGRRKARRRQTPAMSAREVVAHANVVADDSNRATCYGTCATSLRGSLAEKIWQLPADCAEMAPPAP